MLQLLSIALFILSVTTATPLPQEPTFPNNTLSSTDTPILEDQSTPESSERLSSNGNDVANQTSTSYWVANIQRNGQAAFNPNSNYVIYRNVKDFGAVGDGVTDDTAAINEAIATGNRCGGGDCDSTTITPAIVYFPPGTYLVSTPIIQYYYTQLHGDALDLPVLKSTPDFVGIAVVDANPYLPGGANWYTNQNNFFRQIRNFVIDVRNQPLTSGTGIHWQVAQATSLQNIRFEMRRDRSPENAQQGIFMENGSGGFMTDLIFNGGNYGAFFGNQQFTVRNLVFNDCNTAMYMIFAWVWSFKSLTINNCNVGIDISQGGPEDQAIGSIILSDSTISNTNVGILTAFTSDSQPSAAGTLILDNVDFPSTPVAVGRGSTTVLEGSGTVDGWAQGPVYEQNDQRRLQGPLDLSPKPASLLGSDGTIFERSKPQYENFPASAFVSVKSRGAKGDGVTDDTAAIQAAMDSIEPNEILYFDHGAYIITSTVRVPARIKIVGEIWPVIMAEGSFFGDQDNLRPVWQVGEPGQSGSVEMSELMFETKGPAPGAILLQWNLQSAAPGDNGMWDVHARVGGTAGSELQSDTCLKTPEAETSPDPNCFGAGMLLHITQTGSVYIENGWFWVADHELDLPDFSQINLYNGRGVLIESKGPVWMYSTASEHNILYNYQFLNAENVFLSVIQTETPYFQANPDASVPYEPQSAISDPDYDALCTTEDCKKTIGFRVLDSSDILLYGGGLYSFFENYAQECVDTNDCQQNMVSIDNNSQVTLYALATKASVNMVTQGDSIRVLDADNRSVFTANLAMYRSYDLGQSTTYSERLRR